MVEVGTRRPLRLLVGREEREKVSLVDLFCGMCLGETVLGLW